MVCDKNISKPQIGTKRTENRVKDHHADDVDHDNFEDDLALFDHNYIICALIWCGLVEDARVRLREAFEELTQDETHFD